MTLCHLRALITAEFDGAHAVQLSQGEVETLHIVEALEHGLVDAVGPSVYTATVADTDVEIKASDGKVLLVLTAVSCEALKNIVAVDSECVV